MQDEALIKKAQQGDAQAFEQLLELHYDTLFRFAYKWCGNREDAEDVTQQACIKLARSLGQFRFESAFSSWLYRVVVNCARDWGRNQARHPVNGEDPNEQSTGRSVEHQVYAWQLLRQLEGLSDGLKETLLLVHGEGLTHSEAASVLDVKESTVSWRLHEIRKQFGPAENGGGVL
jgi:RNA polymerase sigma-70 factor (ECF subfamily)